MGSGWAALVWEPYGKKLLVTQIYDHQSNLAQAGRTEDARAVYRALADGQWQDRFQWMKTEAKQRLQNR